MPKQCDGCGAKFSLTHALTCKHGGLIIRRHDEIRDTLGDLATKAFGPSAVRKEPTLSLFQSTPNNSHHDNSTEAASTNPKNQERMLTDSSHCTTPHPSSASPLHPVSQQPELRGDLLIRGLWEHQHSCIIDVRMTDPDAASYRTTPTDKILSNQEKEKKKKYHPTCQELRHHFTPFITTTDGQIGQEGNKMLTRLASKLCSKWDAPFGKVKAFVKMRVQIAIVRATHICLRMPRAGIRDSSEAFLPIEDGAGLMMF